MRRAVVCGVVLLGWLGVGLDVAMAEKIYYAAGYGEIWRANLDGTAPERLLSGIGGVRDIALDLVGNKMYWTEGFSKDSIQRANLDGSGLETLVSGQPGNPSYDGIALDVAAGKMYWTDPYQDKIQRANLDGTDITDIHSNVGEVNGGIALDPGHKRIYWTGIPISGGMVRRSNLNGFDVLNIVSGLRSPWGIALDIEGDKVYWTDFGDGRIQRANLNGSGIETILTDVGEPIWIEVDHSGGKVYWAEQVAREIWRANLDGSAPEVIVSGMSQLHGIALDLRPIPEPSALSLAVLSCVCILLYAFRRR